MLQADVNETVFRKFNAAKRRYFSDGLISEYRERNFPYTYKEPNSKVFEEKRASGAGALTVLQPDKSLSI